MERHSSSAPSGNSWNTWRSRLNTLKNNRKDTLFSSGRLFSEGGDFAPQEVKLFQRRLKEESKQISVTEESIYSELEAFESSSLQQAQLLTPCLCLHDNIYTNMWQHQTLHLHSHFVLLVQVKEVSARLEEKLCLLKSEVKFKEKIQKVLSSTQVHLKAEVPVCLPVSLTVSVFLSL